MDMRQLVSAVAAPVDRVNGLKCKGIVVHVRAHSLCAASASKKDVCLATAMQAKAVFEMEGEN